MREALRGRTGFSRAWVVQVSRVIVNRTHLEWPEEDLWVGHLRPTIKVPLEGLLSLAAFGAKGSVLELQFVTGMCRTYGAQNSCGYRSQPFRAGLRSVAPLALWLCRGRFEIFPWQLVTRTWQLVDRSFRFVSCSVAPEARKTVAQCGNTGYTG
jgi:hypothetical protein